MIENTASGNVIFYGTPSKPEERKILRDAGFVHVTGLRYWSPLDESDDHRSIGEDTTDQDLGKWCSNNGMTVLVTTGGETWLKAGFIAEASQAISELAPNGYGTFVPLSNGEQISPYDLLWRVSEPNCNLALMASTS